MRSSLAAVRRGAVVVNFALVGVRKEIACWRVGDYLAVHRSQDDKGCDDPDVRERWGANSDWTVTHAPTGWAVLRLPTRALCIKFCREADVLGALLDFPLKARRRCKGYKALLELARPYYAEHVKETIVR